MTLRSTAVTAVLTLLAVGCAASVNVEVIETSEEAADDNADDQGENDPDPGSTATPVDEPTATSVPTPSPEPTATATGTPVSTATSVPAPTATPSPPPVEFVVAPNAPILGITIGTDADLALLELDALIGEPDFDTGWNVGCPLDGPELNERLVEWGDLDVYFERFDGMERLRAWGYDVRLPEGGFPEIPLISLPGGAQIGDPIEDVAAAAGEPVVYDPVFDVNRVGPDGYDIIAFGDPGSPAWGAFVPFVPTCE
jgi:hypothetical protein